MKQILEIFLKNFVIIGFIIQLHAEFTGPPLAYTIRSA